MQIFHLIYGCNAGLSKLAVLEYSAHLHFHKKSLYRLWRI
ncbi:hypothetical protein PROSTU_01638 [Providencia stuartii ATCC 25827]|uniref:Uncharacterized protein n=1 Tax=Providencia stuartii ATCC 25827 TaxID=471874 RepID=A0AA86YVD7_PROST|nr:hypothetical protein PROSTU_01638 [Providencia stuartii ATCC 25827]